MRLSASLLSAVVIAFAPFAAGAATLSEGFSITVDGYDEDVYPADDLVSDFNPSLGTLTEIDTSLSGSLTWNPGGTPDLLLAFLSPAGSQSYFTDSSSPQSVALDISGVTTDSGTLADWTGTGSQLATLDFDVTADLGSLDFAVLGGSVTFVYTPAAPPAVPEPSSLAILGAALGGLAFVRAKVKGSRTA